MSTRRSQFNREDVGDDGISEPVQSNTANSSHPLGNVVDVKTQLKLENLKDRQTARSLRIVYALIAVGFAIASIIFWMRFIQFYYSPQKHSDTFFATLTTACTINILAAFISIIKGLFPPKK